MKVKSQILALVLGVIPVVGWTQSSSPEEFISVFRSAVQEKSTSKLDAITYTIGMSDSDKQQVALTQKMFFSDGEIDGISLVPLPEDFQTVYIVGGKKLEPTYPPAGFIKIQYKKPEKGIASSSCPYAIIKGQYFIVSTKSTDLGWSGPQDKTISFMVLGNGQDKVQIKAKWNASGVEQERSFKSPSSGLMGQYFEEVIVTSTEDATDVTLTIFEGGKEIFVSEHLKGKGAIKYKKKS